MLRQIHIFQESKQIYNYTYAMGLGDEELENVKATIKSYLDMPMPGKTFQKPLGEFQIFHRSIDKKLFLVIVDLVDNREHIDVILKKIIEHFNQTFSNSEEIKTNIAKLKEFENYLRDIQYELHSKIVITGSVKSGKTTLYNLLKGDQEKNIMNFAKSSIFEIDSLKFDLWDFQLKDNYSLLWSKFINGADLVILLFDLSNYHLRVINHFIDLHRNEGKLSKLIIIGNKRDLVDDEDVKLIKNELTIEEFEEISLNDIDAKEKLIQIISKTIKLKKQLPPNFDLLREEAEQIKNEGNLILALSKYKELINICNTFQDFTYIEEFKRNIKELQEKVEEEKKIRRELDSKRKFEIPGQIKFTKKVSVMPLPRDISEVSKELTPTPVKPEQIKKPSDTQETKIGKLTLFKKESTEIMSDKTSLKPEDIKIEPKTSLEVTPSEPEKEETSLSAFPRKLQELIEKKGSSLSLKLCEHLINELQNTLGRPLNLEDIETAATIFIKQENL